MEFLFQGRPQAKARHRTTKSGHSYNPQSKLEAAAKFEARAQHKGDPVYCPVTMYIWAFFERPKSHYGTGKNSTEVKDTAPTHHVNKPDADNIAKFYSDALNNIAYHDDRQVVGLFVAKCWTEAKGFVRVTVEVV